MTFDPLNPFANGPFILPVSTGPTDTTLRLNIPYQYETGVVYNGPALTVTPNGIIEIKVATTANLASTLNALAGSGDATFVMITQNPLTGDDVRTPITNALDVNAIVAWLNAQATPPGPNPLSNLITRRELSPTVSDPNNIVTIKGPLIPIMTKELEDEANAHTIQRLIEVNFVREGNRLLSTALGNLKDALDNSQGTLDTLGTIQSLHNAVTVTTPSALNFDYLAAHGGTASSYASAYQAAASAYFGPPITAHFLWSSAGAVVVGQPGGGTFANFAQRLMTSRSQLSSYLSDLLPRTPKVTPPALSAGSPVDPNSLYAKSKIVLDNIPNTSNFSAIQKWAADNYNVSEANISGSGKAGQLQQDITFAITAGQSLNDAQKEKVRRYMFVFEEYYKAASAMLTKISELVNKFAQGIRPS